MFKHALKLTLLALTATALLLTCVAAATASDLSPSDRALLQELHAVTAPGDATAATAAPIAAQLVGAVMPIVLPLIGHLAEQHGSANTNTLILSLLTAFFAWMCPPPTTWFQRKPPT